MFMKRDIFFDEDSYQKKRLVDFFINLSYPGGGVPSAEADKKHLKRVIDVSLLMGARSRKDQRTAFSNFETFFIILILVCVTPQI